MTASRTIDQVDDLGMIADRGAHEPDARRIRRDALDNAIDRNDPVGCKYSIAAKSGRIPVAVAQDAAESPAPSDGALARVGVGCQRLAQLVADPWWFLSLW